MKPEEQTISVLDPITPAVGRAKTMLFSPFRVRKWLLVGLLAALAQLTIGGRWLLDLVFKDLPEPTPENIQELLANYEQWLRETLPNIEQWLSDAVERSLPILIGAAIAAVFVSVACLWIRSRGHFLFLNSVARNESKLKEPWRSFAPQGNSLFLFRILLMLLLGMTTLPFVSVIFYQLYPIVVTGELDAGRILASALCFLAACFFGLVSVVINKLTNDFVTPIMFRRQLRWREAWSEFRRLLLGRKGAFSVYLLFQILLQGVLGTGVIVLQGMLSVIFLIAIPSSIGMVVLPFLGVLVILPLLIFDRAYSLAFLAQFGDDYDLFAQSSSPASPPPIEPDATKKPTS
ncbi:MAG: hypothetical protein ACI8QF_003529 [Limisphaerales bacterium]|jgi:hypothetical protein